MNMTPVASCSMSNCAYNSSAMCHTRAINVGYHAECNTFIHAGTPGGFKEVTGGIGACVAANCKFNNRLECTAGGIEVSGHQGHADCLKFVDKDSLE